jgi:hypothetical protein
MQSNYALRIKPDFDPQVWPPNFYPVSRLLPNRLFLEPLVMNVLEGFGLDGNRFPMRLQPSTKGQTAPVFFVIDT